MTQTALARIRQNASAVCLSCPAFPPGGSKPAEPAKQPQSCPFYDIQTTEPLPPHPDAANPLVPEDETEPKSEALIMSYGRNRQNWQKRPLLLCAPRGRVLYPTTRTAPARTGPNTSA